MNSRKAAPQVAGICLLSVLMASPASREESPATKLLKARNSEFKQEVIRVAEGVYTAIGWSASTNSMIVGTDGVIIIDPGQSPVWAKQVRQEFEKISTKPVKAIIYTHGHGDHTSGTPAFLTEGSKIEIWARSNFGSEGRLNQETGIAPSARPVNTQGFDLPPEKRINNGIAQAVYPQGQQTPGGRRGPGAGNGPAAARMGAGATVAPNHTFSEERKRIEIAGVKMDLVKSPGETEDTLYVWLPEQKVVFSGDNFYKSFPNVYPLRGSARRDVRDWADSIDKILKEGAEHLVGGHTRPIGGKALVAEVLTNYRDALRLTWTKAIEGIDKGMTPDELVEYVRLPENLTDKDYLRDYYGSLPQTVREIYSRHMGWFDGNPINLHRPAPRDEAGHMVELAGGMDALLAKAREALRKDQPQWAAQLAWYAMTAAPELPAPKALLADSLDVLGERTLNAPARNYTLAYADLLRRKANVGPGLR